jgi:hypothetical protein
MPCYKKRLHIDFIRKNNLYGKLAMELNVA